MGGVKISELPSASGVQDNDLLLLVNSGNTYKTTAGALKSYLGGSVSGVTESDINLFDYDGTLLYSYTMDEAKTLTALPSPPAHDRLSFQGWNRKLTTITSAKAPMDVGAIYTTASGKSEFDITVTPVTGSSVTVRIYNVSGTLSVDWGDGTVDTSSTIGLNTVTHDYGVSDGEFTITVDSTGTYYPYGSSATPYNMFNVTPNYTCTAVRLGDRCARTGDYAFRTCYSLQTITIPRSVVSVGSYAISYCWSLRACVLPDSLTTTGVYALAYNYSIRRIMLPDTLTSLGAYFAQTCYMLGSLTLPEAVTAVPIYMIYTSISLKRVVVASTVTSIATYAFYGSYSMTELIMLPTSPPTLASVNALTGINGICKIKVPVGSLAAYKAAANWSTYANYMEEIS